jgi:cytoskeleton protein RodZ
VSDFGEKMRREREMRGVSLEEISGSTKIGTRSLKALEEEDFEKLPGGIFNKGFVRAYARFLGLDEEQAVTDFEAAWREHEAEKGPILELQPESPREEPNPTSNRLMVIALVLLAMVAVGYAVRRYLSVRAENRAASQPEVQQVASAPGEAQQQPTAPAASPISKSEVSSNANSMSNEAQSHPAPVDAAPKKADALRGEKTSTTEAATAPTSSAILLHVTALEDSWLSVSADGKNLGEGILNAQKSRTIRANKEVHLRLGNVAGVEVSFNGKPVNIDGEPKQVKELTFTPEGLRQ